jgi:hypothetical protein
MVVEDVLAQTVPIPPGAPGGTNRLCGGVYSGNPECSMRTMDRRGWATVKWGERSGASSECHAFSSASRGALFLCEEVPGGEESSLRFGDFFFRCCLR